MASRSVSGSPVRVLRPSSGPGEDPRLGPQRLRPLLQAPVAGPLPHAEGAGGRDTRGTRRHDARDAARRDRHTVRTTADGLDASRIVAAALTRAAEAHGKARSDRSLARMDGRPRAPMIKAVRWPPNLTTAPGGGKPERCAKSSSSATRRLPP